jgi:hypothetical protein
VEAVVAEALAKLEAMARDESEASSEADEVAEAEGGDVEAPPAPPAEAAPAPAVASTAPPPPARAEAPVVAVAKAPPKPEPAVAKPARAPRGRSAAHGLCAVNPQRGHAKGVAGASYAAESTIYLLPDGQVRTGAQLARRQVGLLSALPPGTRVLIDKRYGGYVKPNRAPSEICGATKWRSADTVYRLPGGELVSGAQVDAARLPRATMVFCAP